MDRCTEEHSQSFAKPTSTCSRSKANPAKRRRREMCGEVGGRETAPPTEGEFPPTFAYLDPYDDTFIFVEIPPFEPAHIEFGAITSVNLVPKVTGEAGVSKSLVVKFFTKEGVIQVDMMKEEYPRFLESVKKTDWQVYDSMANGEESQSSWSARQGGVTGLLAGITRGLDTRLHTDMNKVNQTPKSNGTIPVAEWS